MKHTSLVAVFAAAVAFSLVSSSAKAEDMTLSVGGGAAEVLDTNNADNLFTHNKFQLGENGTGKLMFKVAPVLSLGVQANALYFQDAAPTNNAGVMWTFAPTVKLQSSHDASSYVYVDGAFGPSVQNHVWNPGLIASAGWDISLEETRTFWAGPYVSYTHIWDTAGSQPSLLTHHDMNTAVVGLELAFDFPVKQKTNTVVSERVVQVDRRVEVPGPCPPAVAQPAPPVRPTMQLSERVLFAIRSSDLDATATATLDEVSQKLLANPSVRVVVEGSASMDGDREYNLKLSHRRANAVVKYLVGKGVDASRMKASSLGAVGEAGDVSNRSAEFIVITFQ